MATVKRESYRSKKPAEIETVKSKRHRKKEEDDAESFPLRRSMRSKHSHGTVTNTDGVNDDTLDRSNKPVNVPKVRRKRYRKKVEFDLSQFDFSLEKATSVIGVFVFHIWHIISIQKKNSKNY